MRGSLLLAALLLAAPARVASTEVSVADGKLSVRATGVSLSEVLGSISRRTGMKVVFEGPVPRHIMTIALVAEPESEAISKILEGLGLGYGLMLDAGGTHVSTLLVRSAGGPTANLTATASPSPLLPMGLAPPSAPSVSPPAAADEEAAEEALPEAPLVFSSDGLPMAGPPESAGTAAAAPRVTVPSGPAPEASPPALVPPSASAPPNGGNAPAARPEQ